MKSNFTHSEYSIIVDGVSVEYSTYRVMRNPQSRNPLERVGLLPSKTKKTAVKRASLSAKPGEIIGVIGRNGSGKSSLLRAVSGLHEVAEGAVYAVSQPFFLGVKPALISDRTGYENIELGCLAMGLSKDEVRRAIADIAELTALEDALYDPINTYSSGMRARLGFCILAAVPDVDILVVDEALGTGDAAFKDRSKEIMKSVLARSGTIFLVSHSGKFIKEMCKRAIWLHEGEIIMDGVPDDVVASYVSYTRLISKHKGEEAKQLIMSYQERYVPPIFNIQ